ncbi:MAG: hypothetical protein JO102_01320, partial [Elusimicrobia bacterium]|nr:hypothetical protein [Elusimicrobiota bacterium]
DAQQAAMHDLQDAVTAFVRAKSDVRRAAQRRIDNLAEFVLAPFVAESIIHFNPLFPFTHRWTSWRQIAQMYVGMLLIYGGAIGGLFLHATGFSLDVGSIFPALLGGSLGHLLYNALARRLRWKALTLENLPGKEVQLVVDVAYRETLDRSMEEEALRVIARQPASEFKSELIRAMRNRAKVFDMRSLAYVLSALSDPANVLTTNERTILSELSFELARRSAIYGELRPADLALAARALERTDRRALNAQLALTRTLMLGRASTGGDTIETVERILDERSAPPVVRARLEPLVHLDLFASERPESYRAWIGDLRRASAGTPMIDDSLWIARHLGISERDFLIYAREDGIVLGRHKAEIYRATPRLGEWRREHPTESQLPWTVENLIAGRAITPVALRQVLRDLGLTARDEGDAAGRRAETASQTVAPATLPASSARLVPLHAQRASSDDNSRPMGRASDPRPTTMDNLGLRERQPEFVSPDDWSEKALDIVTAAGLSEDELWSFEIRPEQDVRHARRHQESADRHRRGIATRFERWLVTRAFELGASDTDVNFALQLPTRDERLRALSDLIVDRSDDEDVSFVLQRGGRRRRSRSGDDALTLGVTYAWTTSFFSRHPRLRAAAVRLSGASRLKTAAEQDRRIAQRLVAPFRESLRPFQAARFLIDDHGEQTESQLRQRLFGVLMIWTGFMISSFLLGSYAAILAAAHLHSPLALFLAPLGGAV